MTGVVAVDIGGTHARFAIAEIEGGDIVRLGSEITLRTADYPSLQSAWEAFADANGAPLPRAAAIAVASPIGGDSIRPTNGHWAISRALIERQLNVDRWTLINDFAAIGHAVARLGPDSFAHICGPDRPLPDEGVITVCGPGTGFGAAAVLRHRHGWQIVESEGGHMDFAPLDTVDDAILQRLREIHGRVSVERVVSGPGIVAIHDTLAAMNGQKAPRREAEAIWAMAIDGDRSASATLDRFCLSLGSVAGDVALAQGAAGVVIAGGLALRLRDRLPGSGFGTRFAAKGRLTERMSNIPVKLIIHPQPGLCGAAAAFAQGTIQ